MLRKIMVYSCTIICATFFFSTKASAQAEIFDFNISQWDWPVKVNWHIHEHINNITTIENTNFGVRNLDLVYHSPTRLNCLQAGWFRQYHAGVDFYNRDGSMKRVSVYAIADGEIVSASNGYPGYTIIIQHPVTDDEMVYSVYMHLEPEAISDAIGEFPPTPDDPIPVSKGEKIGEVLWGEEENNNQDYNGRFPADLHPDGDLDDSHLHFEIQTFGLDKPYDDNEHSCGGKLLPAGLGYTYPETPEEVGYLDPMQFLSERINTHQAYLPLVTGGMDTGASTTSTCVTGSNLLAMHDFDEAGPPYRPWFEISSAYGATLKDDTTLRYYPFVATVHSKAKTPSPVRSSPQAAMYNVPLDTDAAITQRDEELLQSFVAPVGATSVGVSFQFKFWGKILGMDPDDRILFELTEGRTGRPLWRDEIDKDALEQDTWYNQSVAATPITAGQRYSMRMSLLTYEDGGIIDVRDTYMAIDDVQVIVQCG